MRHSPTATLASALATVGALLGVAAPSVSAQTQQGDPAPAIIHACAVPLIGTMYLIKQAGLPDKCFGPSTGSFKHTEVSWNQKGEKGEKGDQGLTGDKGGQGEKGEKGEPGPAGANGAAGEKGEKGEKGDACLSSDVACRGLQGPAGPTGPAGPQGPPGAQGPQGPAGGGAAANVPCHECVTSGTYAGAVGFFTSATGGVSFATGQQTTASAGYSTAMGGYSTASGEFATAVGDHVVASGVASTALGSFSNASGINSTAIGTGTKATGDYSMAIGVHASTNDRVGAFVYGDATCCGTVNATADHQFMVRASGGTIFYSNSALTAGVSLPAGGGAWESVSDVNRKTLFRDVSGELVLSKIARIPVREWSYKSQNPSIRHLGPTAQDFRAAFGLGQSDTTITTTDIDGVNLLAVQALGARTERLQAQNTWLARENRALRAALARQSREHANLERRLARLESAHKTER